MYKVQTSKFEKPNDNVSRIIRTTNIEATSDDEAKNIFWSKEWGTKEDGKQLHILIVSRPNTQGKSEELAKSFTGI